MVTGDNQLFIPHYEKSRGLYAEFKAGYMSASQVILEEKGLENMFSIKDFMTEYEEYAEDFLLSNLCALGGDGLYRWPVAS